MDPKPAESVITTPASAETADDLQSDTGTEQAPRSPKALVAQMVAAGVWPEPELLEKIVQAGDAVVKPLLAVVRTYPRGWPEEAPLHLAIGLLSVLRPPRAIPELIQILRRYVDDVGEAAARALGAFGPAAFEPLLEVLRDPAIRGYRRSHAIDAVQVAAGNDPALRAQVAEVLRFFLADAIERGRDEIRQWKMRRDLEESSAQKDFKPTITEVSETVVEKSGTTSSDGGPIENKEDLQPNFYEEIACLISNLADLADPLARDLIKTAFDEELVETFVIDRNSVDETYDQGGMRLQEVSDWLDIYREQYQQHTDSLNRPPTPPPIPIRLPAKAPSEPEADSLTPVETIRNVGPKLGRNDPCWCGSGKKYKKCHLGKDSFR